MSAFKVISVKIVTNVGQYVAQMGSAGVATAKLGQVANVTSKSHADLGATLGKVAGVAGITLVAGLVAAVGAASKFEAAMRNVNSLSGLSEQQFKAQGKAVIDLSKTLPQSATTLAEGLYDIASSGFQGADGLTVLKASAQAASAGISDTATAARAITGVLNAYGMGAEQAGAVSDTLFSTVNLGVVSFGELAGSIGDVLGMASAAQVPIDQVGSAIAAMTLAGVGGAEATTSLTRLIEKLITPSDALAALYKKLGYESGSSALQQKGLRGVIEDVRKATGGQIDSLLALFPEIRAARGAFALMSAEGKNYAKTAEGIEDANNRTGATAKVLAEQSKSFAFQMQLTKNQVMAWGIALGQQVTPQLLRFRDAVQDGGRRALPVLLDAMHRMSPTFTGIADTAKSLVIIFRNLWEQIEPVVVGFAKLGAGAVIVALNTLATILGGVTGFLADHKELVLLVASIYVASLVPAITAAVVEFVALAQVAIGVWFLEGAAAVRAFAAGMDTAAASASLLSGAVTLGIGTAIYSVISTMQSGKKAVKEFRGEIVQGLDLSSLSGLDAAMGRLDVKAGSAQDALNRRLGSAGAGLQDLLPGPSETDRLQAVIGDVTKFQKELTQFRGNLVTNADAVARQTGISREQVLKLAKTTGVDLTAGFEASSAARKKLTDQIGEMGKKAGLSSQQLAKAGGQDIAQMEAIAAAAEEMAKDVSKAFAGATDVLSKWDPSKQSLGDFYKDTITSATRFAADIQTVTRRGLDPSVVVRLLKAGPEQARPILDAMLVDHSGKTLRLINDSEKALETLNMKVVEMSRLTALAVGSTSDKMVRDLGNAMRIAAINADQGAKATLTSVAKAAGIPAAEVTRIAAEFGITITGAIDKVGLAADTAAGKVAGLRQILGVGGIVIDSVTGEAHGDGVRLQASGGIEPHIANTATMIHGERGPEAYIPLVSFRQRALDLHAEVGRRIGAPQYMAQGGIVPNGPGIRFAMPASSGTSGAPGGTATVNNINITGADERPAMHIAREILWQLKY